MNNTIEIRLYVSVFLVLVSAILPVVLASSARSLIGRLWLIASVALTLVHRLGDKISSLVFYHSHDPRPVAYWYGMSLLEWFSTACFGMFLFSIWSSSRIRLDMRGLLFSFSGRIPRSAFWISMCILFPLGTSLGFLLFASNAGGIAKGIIWTVCAVGCVPSCWISLAVYTKRWHDCGKSGWMSLILLLPIIGPFWFLGYCGFVRGTSGPNQYGDDPLITETA